MNQTTTATLLNLRAIDPPERLLAVFAALDALPPGDSLCIAHDHEPKAL